jgi:hypothetical protein
MNETGTPLVWKRLAKGEHLATSGGNSYKVVIQSVGDNPCYECWFKYQDTPWSFVIHQDKVKYGKHYLPQFHDQVRPLAETHQTGVAQVQA